MRTTRREDIGTIIGGTWIILGLFLDGFAHENFRELESFWTPWHAVFYSGFGVTAFWIAKMVQKRRPSVGSWKEAIPDGYLGAVIGTFVFAVGGVGDAIWHTVFGVEATIDALLSPTHVILFSGMVFILTAPLRSWTHGDREGGWRPFVPAFVSMTLAVSLVAFFFVYLWGPGVTWLFRIPFNPITEEGALAVMAGMGAAMVSTLIMITPILHLLRFGRIPFLATTIMWGWVNLLIVAAFDRDPVAIPAALVAGLAADLIIARVSSVRLRSLSVGLVAPAVLWSASFAAQFATQGVAWQPELWGGVIVFASLAGLTLAGLTQPITVGETDAVQRA